MSATETQLEAVRAAVEPAVAALGLDLYDVELARRRRRAHPAGHGRPRDGGVDLDAITAVTRAVSPLVDDDRRVTARSSSK